MVAAFFWGMPGILILLAVGLPLLALKEFFYDLRYELPNDTVSGSALDFGCYLIGVAVAVGLACIKFYALSHP